MTEDPAGRRSAVDRFRRLPGDWRAAVVGGAAAPGLVLVGLVVGLVDGALLPWDCQGLACLFTAVILIYSAGLLVVWTLLAVLVRLARRRWPTSAVRTWVLWVLAAASWAVALYPVVVVAGWT